MAEAYLSLLAERGIEYLFAKRGTDFVLVDPGAGCDQCQGDHAAVVRSCRWRTGEPESPPRWHTAITSRPATGGPCRSMSSVGTPPTASTRCSMPRATRDRCCSPPGARRCRNITTAAALHRHPLGPGVLSHQAATRREACKWDYEAPQRRISSRDVVDRALETAQAGPDGPVYQTLFFPRRSRNSVSRQLPAAPSARCRSWHRGPSRGAADIWRKPSGLSSSRAPAHASRLARLRSANSPSDLRFPSSSSAPSPFGRGPPSDAGRLQPSPHLQEADVSNQSDVPWISTGAKFKGGGGGGGGGFWRLPMRSFP